MIYSRVNKNITEYDYYVKGLATLDSKKRFSPFVIGIYQYTQRRLIDFRLISGLGISHKLIDKKNHALYTQIAILYDYTTYDSNDFKIIGLQKDNTRKIIRLSPRIVGEHYFKNKDIKIDYTYWFHNSFQDIRDTRMRLDININYKITNWFSFKTSLDYFFENFVLKGVNSSDLLVSFGIASQN